MPSKILIGTDEAGYGPNLGPLTITATAWEIPAEVSPNALWNELRKVLTNVPARGDDRLFVADSKAVYSSGDDLEGLEVPVLAFLRSLGHETSSIDSIAQIIAGSEFEGFYRDEPWNPTPGQSLPIAASEDHIAEWSDVLSSEMVRQGIRLLDVRSRVMFPREFNSLVEKTDSKGAVLSSATLELVKSLTESWSKDMVTLVVCDKHGGRNRYDGLISSLFDDQFVFRLEESRQTSKYRMGSIEFCFRTKAEELLPVALASMVSKYLREVLMHQFNAFWAARIPGLKPTQGYPVDAKRFRSDIAETIASMQLPEEILWRSR